MKKKSLISMIAALSLTACVMVGATLAYLTAQTEEVTNTFTIGNVNIKLEEPNWKPENAENLEPGAEVAKDPTVTNTGKNDAYIAVTVDGMEEMALAGFSAVVNNGVEGKGNWVKVDEAGNVDMDWDGAIVDGIYAYDSVVAKEDATAALFQKVAFNGLSSTNVYTVEGVAVDPQDQAAGVYYIVRDADGKQVAEEQFATETAARNYIDSNLMNMDVTSFDLVVKAYAIQTKGFEDAAAYAWVNEIDFTK